MWVFSTDYPIVPIGSQVWGPLLGADKSGTSASLLLDYNG